MKFNSYNIIARFFPAILASIPLLLLHFYFLRNILGDFIGQIMSIKIIADISISLVFIYLIAQIARLISKILYEEKIFRNGLFLPTTNYLLHLDSHYTPDYTKKIHAKVLLDFKINIPLQKQEANDELMSRKKICEAVSHIRAKVQQGHLVGQHNIEYGFIRNLIGGSIIAVFISLVNLFIFRWISFNKTAFITSLILFIIFSLFIVLGKKLIIWAGEGYAKILIQEYMSK